MEQTVQSNKQDEIDFIISAELLKVVLTYIVHSKPSSDYNSGQVFSIIDKLRSLQPITEQE
jgi:hypothetical protein